MDEVIGTVVGRWYVTLFGLTFAYFAVRHLGWRRTLLYSVAAFAVGAAAENASVRWGIPYTRYAFDPSLRGDELWIGNVPLFVPLSYTFMGYFAFAAGRLVASGPRHTRGRRPSVELAASVLLGVWALWIVDPVSRLGDEFYLGPVFSYAGPGFWFGLPLGSQLGFTATAIVLVSMLHALAGAEPDRAVARPWRHPHVPALVTYLVQVFHLAVIAIVIDHADIGGAAFLIAIPTVCAVALYWSALRERDIAEASSASGSVAGQRTSVDAR